MDDARKEHDELIADIRDDVMVCLQLSGFFEKLDDLLSPIDNSVAAIKCSHTYSISTPLLKALGFPDEDIEDIFNVVRSEGGCCDCEILYNVSEKNRLKGKYWRGQYDELMKGPRRTKGDIIT
jgi:hypothetical protein